MPGPPRPPGRLPPRWRVSYKGDVFFVHARTRSEARAAAKRELSVPRKGRLPAGVVIMRV